MEISINSKYYIIGVFSYYNAVKVEINDQKICSTS